MVAEDVFPDVLHAHLKVGEAVGRVLRDEGHVVAEPAHQLPREEVSQVVGVVLDPGGFVVEREGYAAFLEPGELAPQDLVGAAGAGDRVQVLARERQSRAA
jgi:hypothetical protein